MQVTGKNLLLLRAACWRALEAVAMDIGSCPDPDAEEYADLISQLCDEREEYETLLARVQRAIDQQNGG